mmetsp:Transcript_81064/g.224280  ORF Transcript_81064/g.224280 Transcript_81064/m.224280 type:complete len:292 (+) Transcript_81064:365-1240(+)
MACPAAPLLAPHPGRRVPEVPSALRRALRLQLLAEVCPPTASFAAARQRQRRWPARGLERGPAATTRPRPKAAAAAPALQPLGAGSGGGTSRRRQWPRSHRPLLVSAARAQPKLPACALPPVTVGRLPSPRRQACCGLNQSAVLVSPRLLAATADLRGHHASCLPPPPAAAHAALRGACCGMAPEPHACSLAMASPAPPPPPPPALPAAPPLRCHPPRLPHQGRPSRGWCARPAPGCAAARPAPGRRANLRPKPPWRPLAVCREWRVAPCAAACSASRSVCSRGSSCRGAA